MYHFNIKVAGIVIEVASLHTRVQAITRDFHTLEKPMIKVSSTQQELDEERENYVRVTGYRNDPWDGFIEVSAILKKISLELIEYDTILFHGAVIGLGDNSFLFTAPSGIGKTTHILNWKKHCPDSYVINGDKPFIKFSDADSPPLACGSPWAGKENIYTNISVPLSAVVFLERAENNSMKEMSFAEAFPFLLQQTYCPDDEEKMRKTLRLLQRLNGKVRFYRFLCNNFKDDCFYTSYNMLVEKK